MIQLPGAVGVVYGTSSAHLEGATATAFWCGCMRNRAMYESDIIIPLRPAAVKFCPYCGSQEVRTC